MQLGTINNISVLIMLLLPAISTLFPYTTLFRSRRGELLVEGLRGQPAHDQDQVQGEQPQPDGDHRSEEHTSELQSQSNLVCRLLLEKKNKASRPLPIRFLHKKARQQRLSINDTQ